MGGARGCGEYDRVGVVSHMTIWMSVPPHSPISICGLHSDGNGTSPALRMKEVAVATGYVRLTASCGILTSFDKKNLLLFQTFFFLDKYCSTSRTHQLFTCSLSRLPVRHMATHACHMDCYALRDNQFTVRHILVPVQ